MNPTCEQLEELQTKAKSVLSNPCTVPSAVRRVRRNTKERKKHLH